MEEKRLQMSESFFLTAILAIVGGFLDAYSYLMRGHVFANAQTGNIVLFGVYLEKRNFTQAIYYLVPILAFAVGVILVEIVKHFYKEEHKIHWRQRIVACCGKCINLLCMLNAGRDIPKSSWTSICKYDVHWKLKKWNRGTLPVFQNRR